MLGAQGLRPMRRGPLLLLLATASAALSFATSCREAAPPAPTAAAPNLLLVSVDTLRADHLACYGGRTDVGASLCSLADGGTRFEWALSTAPYTAPSVASILTGVYPSIHGVRQVAGSYLPHAFETLPELLKTAGYTTAAFVSNPVLERSRQLDQGFDVFDQRMPRTELNRPGFAEREAQATTDAALAWAQMHAKSPWFLWVHYQDPHGPYDPPGAAPERDEPGAAKLPLLSDDESGFGGIPAYQELPGVFTPAAYERRYAAEIRYLERHLLRLIAGLDALGAPPAVLLTADHGEAFGEDGYYFAHGHSVGLDQIRVPLLWRPTVPGVSRVARAPVSSVDIAPTLLRIAGVAAPARWPGHPLPLAETDIPAAPERAIFAEHSRRTAVVVGSRYYARDRGAVAAEPEPDRFGDGEPEPHSPAPSAFTELAARTAELDSGGTPSVYRPADPDGAAADLERALATFVMEAAVQPPGPTRETVSDELRQRLRALGYSD
jgi:arylsulfatase A-like enzyme